jgi:uncharacterized caspase-like protein
VSLRSTDSVAIVIGVDGDKSGSQPLQYARADASAIVEHLVEALGLDSKNIWFLTHDVTADSLKYKVNLRDIQTPDSISTAIGEAASRTELGTKFYFYFSGHQYVRQKTSDLDTKPNYFFVLPNSDPSPSGLSTMYSWDALVGDLYQIEHRVIIVIIDSCYSGSVSAGYPGTSGASSAVGTSKQMGAFSEGRLPPKKPLSSNALLTSSSEDEESWEFKSLGHGVFTELLLKTGEWARGQKADLTLQHMFYDAQLVEFPGNGVLGMTKQYNPGDASIHYKQTPYAQIDSHADETLWAHYKSN